MDIKKHAICCEYHIVPAVTTLNQTAVKKLKQCRNINKTVHDCDKSGHFQAPSNRLKF